MKKQSKIITVLPIIILIIGFLISNSKSDLKEATFANLDPSVTIDSIKYNISDIEIPNDELGNVIANVTKKSEIVSYLDSENPYKSVDYIKSVLNEDSSEVVAVRINGRYYLAKRVE